jgi:methyl-accepting chemotaxis protein/sigma-B regulation protein RsbU (phosphoserine phosphatase)
LKNDQAEGEAIITFSLPIYAQGGKVIGVLAVDLSLSLLSDIVLSAKPSPNSYATLLGSDGSFIVHPDSEKVLHKTIYMSDSYQTNKELREAEDAMVAGETGYKHFRLDGTDNYVFYKPFIRADVPGRSMERTGWSVGIIYPEDDIFGDYNQLLYMVIAIALVGLVLLMTGCQMITHRCLLPLRMLAKSSQRIAEGHYDEPVPDSHQWDEVGRLQDHFQQMQQALSVHIGELERLTTELRERNVVLAGAYEQAKDADRVKTAFLHNMTDQMIKPVSVIQSSVNMLCEHRQDMDQQEANKTEETIQEQGKIVTKLLNDLLDVSQEKMEE